MTRVRLGIIGVDQPAHVAARILERVTPLLRIHEIGIGDLEDRIERFVAARLQLHEAIAPVARAARVASHRNELIREQYDRRTAILREQIDRHFATELRAMTPKRRRAVSAGIDALCQLDGLDHFRVEGRGTSPYPWQRTSLG